MHIEQECFHDVLHEVFWCSELTAVHARQKVGQTEHEDQAQRVTSQNLGNPTTAARQHSWEAADVHMRSSQTVPELYEYDEKWCGDD